MRACGPDVGEKDDRITDMHFAALEDDAEYAAGPVRAEGILQACVSILHQFAGESLAPDFDQAGTDAQALATRAVEIDAADHEVGAAQRRVDGLT